MPFKLPRMARKEGVERWVVDRYRGRDKVARIRGFWENVDKFRRIL